MEPRPKGLRPEQFRTPERFFTSIDMHDYHSGVPIQGFDTIQHILNTSWEGLLSGINQRKQQMVEGAEYTLPQGAVWKDGIDHTDFSRLLWDSSFDIEVVPNKNAPDSYVVFYDGRLHGLSEEEIAQKANSEVLLQRRTITAELPVTNERFRIDFDQILRRIQMTTGGLDSYLTGEEFAQRLKAEPQRKRVERLRLIDTTRARVLGEKDGVGIAIEPGEELFDKRYTSRGRDLWIGKKSMLSGPYTTQDPVDPHLGKYKDNPRILITVASTESGGFNTRVLDPQTSSRIRTIGDQVVEALKAA